MRGEVLCKIRLEKEQDQIRVGLASHGKESGCFLKRAGKPFEGFKRRSDMS